MTDLEITRLCAEAMELEALSSVHGADCIPYLIVSGGTTYDPLHDDAQVMALVKKFNLFNNHIFISKDISREICECVAKMQAEK